MATTYELRETIYGYPRKYRYYIDGKRVTWETFDLLKVQAMQKNGHTAFSNFSTEKHGMKLIHKQSVNL